MWRCYWRSLKINFLTNIFKFRFLQTPLTKMSNTTPHYYPKYAICSIENNCGTVPFERVESCASWRRVLELFLFPQVLTFQSYYCRPGYHSLQTNKHFIQFSNVSHIFQHQSYDQKTIVTIVSRLFISTSVDCFQPFPKLLLPTKQTNK